VVLGAMMVAGVGCGDDGAGAGVGDGGGPIDDDDAGIPQGPPALEVGTGLDAFVPLDDGDPVPLTQGRQAGGRRDGGFHIWVGLQLTNVARDDVELLPVEIVDADGAVRASTALLSSRLVGDDGVALVAVGINPILEDCCDVADGTAILRARVEPRDGVALSPLADEVRVMVGSCLDDGRDLCE